jgi:hypothetical protein
VSLSRLREPATRRPALGATRFEGGAERGETLGRKGRLDRHEEDPLFEPDVVVEPAAQVLHVGPRVAPRTQRLGQLPGHAVDLGVLREHPLRGRGVSVPRSREQHLLLVLEVSQELLSPEGEELLRRATRCGHRSARFPSQSQRLDERVMVVAGERHEGGIPAQTGAGRGRDGAVATAHGAIQPSLRVSASSTSTVRRKTFSACFGLSPIAITPNLPCSETAPIMWNSTPVSLVGS